VLSAISFSDGSPHNMTILVPEHGTILKSNDQKFVSTLILSDIQTICYICSYWDMAMQLAKPLPAHAMTCYFEGARNGGVVNAWFELNTSTGTLPPDAIDNIASEPKEVILDENTVYSMQTLAKDVK
jgi:hypothetical protein